MKRLFTSLYTYILLEILFFLFAATAVCLFYVTDDYMNTDLSGISHNVHEYGLLLLEKMPFLRGFELIAAIIFVACSGITAILSVLVIKSRNSQKNREL